MQGHTCTHAQNGMFDTILDTSSLQPIDKQDGGWSICHIAFYTFEWGLCQSDLWLVLSLVLMLVLMLTQFSLVKAMTLAWAQAQEEWTCPFFLCLNAYVDPVFTCLHMCLCLLCLCSCASENQALETLLKNHRLNLQLLFLEVSGVVYSAYYGTVWIYKLHFKSVILFCYK